MKTLLEVNLPQDWLHEIRRMAGETLPPTAEVWLFGSRATGRAHDGSDLDLLVVGAGADGVRLFREGLREGSLPVLSDVHRWEALPEPMRRACRQERQRLV